MRAPVEGMTKAPRREGLPVACHPVQRRRHRARVTPVTPGTAAGPAGRAVPVAPVPSRASDGEVRMGARRWLAVMGGTVAMGLAATGSAAAQSGPQSQTGRGGAAATLDRTATRAAIAALEDGANAVD